MKTCIRILSLAMAMLMFSGCGGKMKASAPQPLGTLAAIEYGRSVDMVWGENFSVRVAPGTVVFIDFFVEEDRDYRFESGIPLEDDQWQQLESAALELLPGLTEIKPKKETLWERLFKKEEPFLLDGADSSTLSFDWETENGIVTVNYNWKYDDSKMQELISLLKSLQNNIKGE
ncbi:MAG: hypothetical protein J6R82_06690 [Clostridia bacterium]|nr:hypothetical protein [Clostridia bacterium]